MPDAQPDDWGAALSFYCRALETAGEGETQRGETSRERERERGAGMCAIADRGVRRVEINFGFLVSGVGHLSVRVTVLRESAGFWCLRGRSPPKALLPIVGALARVDGSAVLGAMNPLMRSSKSEACAKIS